MTADSARREEILDTAASLFATSGIRTSLREIADACGILPGSIYHHFESKDAIIIELVQRYRDELDGIAKESLDRLHESDAPSVEARVIALGSAIASCAVRNRAALLLTLYEPPTTAADELGELARETPNAIVDAMLEILEAARSVDAFRREIELPLLAERICDSMLHIGVGVFHRSQAARDLPAQKCRVLLHGVAARERRPAVLDRSSAMKTAREVVASWEQADDDDRVGQLRSVARAEFGRRGYEATTIRDIAKAAGMSTATVYRMFESKDELLISIMMHFAEAVAAGWDLVLRSKSSALEQLDALMWVNINVLVRFSEEARIQLAWLRQSPPTSVDLGSSSFARQIKQLRDLLVRGERSGELAVEGESALGRARSMYELILTPENVIHHAGPARAQSLARATVLNGAMVRR
jgi:AcrR family transcriptional regulator